MRNFSNWSVQNNDIWDSDYSILYKEYYLNINASFCTKIVNTKYAELFKIIN